MKTVVLYLDGISAPMEKLVCETFPESIDVKFLNPKAGEKGILEEANYLLATNYLVTKTVIDQAPHLKMIQRTGVGYDNVDVAYATIKGVAVSITRGTNASSVAELVLLYMLALYRKLLVLDRQSKSGVWDSWKYRHESFELLGATVGIIGLGVIGRELIKRLQPFGVKIRYYDVEPLPLEEEQALGVSYCTLDSLLKTSDIVTVHVPWNESTRGLLDGRKLALLKPNAILVNTARGPIVDQEALVEAVREKRIAGAALDVFDPEPFSPGSDVLQFDNIITTPHVGAATLDNYKRVFNFCSANIQRLENGEKPENMINSI